MKYSSGDDFSTRGGGAGEDVRIMIKGVQQIQEGDNEIV